MENSKLVKTVCWSEAKESKAVAYCHKHHRFMTIRQMRTKGCLQKGCNRFEKVDCSYWKEREIKKERKLLKAELGIPAYCKIAMKGNQIEIVV